LGVEASGYGFVKDRKRMNPPGYRIPGGFFMYRTKFLLCCPRLRPCLSKPLYLSQINPDRNQSCKIDTKTIMIIIFIKKELMFQLIYAHNYAKSTENDKKSWWFFLKKLFCFCYRYGNMLPIDEDYGSIVNICNLHLPILK